MTLAICFGIVVLSGLGRAAYSFGHPTPSPGLLTLGDPVQSYFVLVQLASVVAITITLLNLNAQRIEFDHQQVEQALQRDNLERRRAEEQLRQSELRLHRAQESADVGVWELELATGAVYRSPECARINGLSPEAEAVDAAWRARVHPEDLDRVDRALAPAIREGGRFEAEYRIRLPDGRERWLLTKGVAQCDPHGRPVRLLGVNIDLTERKRAELAIQRLNEDLEARVRERTAELETSNADLIAAKEVAEAASRAKSAFLANMSHELRTPLSAVIGMVGLMRRDSLDARTLDRLGKVETASRHLMDVINDILDLSKIEAERLTLDRVAFSLDSVRERVLNVMGGVAEAKGLALDFRLPPDLAAEPLRGDPLRLAQVLLNLIGNAIKFTPTGQVQVEVRLLMRAPTEVSLRFDVRDTGVGIEAQDLRRLFQPFEQVDTSLARRHGGTGLGLAISRRLVEIMGGEVGVHSEPGRGSEFWFTARIARGVDLRRPLTAGSEALRQ